MRSFVRHPFPPFAKARPLLPERSEKHALENLGEAVDALLIVSELQDTQDS